MPEAQGKALQTQQDPQSQNSVLLAAATSLLFPLLDVCCAFPPLMHILEA